MTLKEWRSCPEYLFTDALELLKKQEPNSFMDRQYYEQVLFEIIKKLEEQPKLENGVWLKHVEYPDNRMIGEK